ncbi:hypothetical protein ACG83_34015 [Frankia sp. R43]|nr:hypothetical protein ACG83_34015 [Frankia sp. R43]
MAGRQPGGPAPVPGPVQGRIVFDSAWFPIREHGSSGFSMMGSRRLLLTDRPAVYVHETNVLGAGVFSALEPAVDPDASVELVESSTRLFVNARLPGDRTLSASTVAPLPPDALAVLTSLQGRLLADAASTSFVSPCAVSVTLLFEDDPAAGAAAESGAVGGAGAEAASPGVDPTARSGAAVGIGPVEAGATAPGIGGAGRPHSSTFPFPAAPAPPAAPARPVPPAPPVPPLPPAAPAAPALPELTAYVVLRGGRLELRSRGRTLVDWPRNRIELTAMGPTAARLRGGAVLDGRFLTGVILHLVTPQVLHAFLTAAAAATATGSHRVAGAARPAGSPEAAGVAAALGEGATTADEAGRDHSGEHPTPPRTGPAQFGTSAAVAARGVAGSADVARLDCVLHDTTLELQEVHSSQVVARFDLTDSRLRVAGSAERFVLFDPEHGPVTVQCESAAFGRRLQEHPGVRTAAERTLATGPYPAELADGRPVACAVSTDALRVRGPGVDLYLPFSALREVAGTSTQARAELRVTAAATAATGMAKAAEAADATIVGQLELVRAVHTDIVAGRNALTDPRHIADMLRAAAGLEEDYFLYTIFGPFYELHAVLLGDGIGARLGGQVPLPGDDEGRARTAATLAEGLVELQRHLDQVGSVLPAFVRHRDARLLEPLTGGREPAWLKAQEGRLRAALAPAQRAAAETGQLAAQVSRLLDLDPATLPRPDYTGAAVSLGVAALLNPVFLVSGASQVYSRYAQGEKRVAAVGAQSARGWATVIDRWNTLVTTTLPVLGYVLTENLFAPRWETTRQMALELRGAPVDVRHEVLRAVARRLARLDVLRRYPANSGIRVGRGAIADHLRAARDAVSTPRFADF